MKLLFWKIVTNSKNGSEIWKKKASHKFVEFVESNTFHFDLHSRLSIRLNIFQFSTKISKTNLKNKTFHLFVELVETNPLMYNILQFDEYSRLAILLHIFRFSAKIFSFG